VRLPADVPLSWDAADCIAEGRDPLELLNSAEPVNPNAASSKSKVRVLDIDELEDVSPPQWLVDGIIPQGSLILLWGRSGDLKSTVALDLAMSVATGHLWHGKATQQGLVVFVAAEGISGLSARATGWRRTKGADLPKPLFKLVPHTIIKVKRNGDRLEVINRAPEGKQKDAEEFATVRLRTQKVSYASKDEERSTLVLMQDDGPVEESETSENQEKPKLSRLQTIIVEFLGKATKPLSLADLAKSTAKQNTSLLRAHESLVGKGQVVELNDDPERKLWKLR
jgi:hypothetical protein